MVGAAARAADAAEREPGDGELEHRDVDADAARARPTLHLAGSTPGIREHIERKRIGVRVDDPQRFFDAGEGVNCEHGAEDLVAHEPRRELWVAHDRRRDVAVKAVERASDRDLATVVAQERGDAVEVAVVDDPAVVAAHLRIGAVELANCVADLFDESIGHGVFNEHIVGSDTSLPGVQEPSPGDSPRGDGHVGVRKDQGGVLSPELERDRSQVWGRGLEDGARRVRSPRVDHVIDAGRDRVHHLVVTTFDDDDGGRIEMLEGELSERSRGRRRELGGLDDDTVARGQRRDGRGERQVDGIVPRCDYEHDPERLTRDAGTRRLLRERDAGAFRSHPATQAARRVVDLGCNEGEVCQPPFDRRLAEVLTEGGKQPAFALGDERAQARELLAPPFDRLARAAADRRAKDSHGCGDGRVRASHVAVRSGGRQRVARFCAVTCCVQGDAERSCDAACDQSPCLDISGSSPLAGYRCTRLWRMRVADVEVIETPELGDRSYVAHDGSSAIVVDPQRDIDRVEAVLDERGLSCAVVAETHLHNDYVTGGFELARRSGAAYLLSSSDEVDFERHGVDDGDVLDVGTLNLRVISTPGHTYNHLAYVVEDRVLPPVLFSGGSLLYGSVGRTDLLGAEHANELARLQYQSVRRLADSLDGDAAFYPTHGFGSFCSAGPPSSDESGTIRAERSRNTAFTIENEDEFVERVLEGYGAFPTYYAQMAPINKRGPSGADLSPVARLEPDELKKRIAAGEWVVDLRERVAFAHQHLAGTFSFPLEEPLSTYLGWLRPWEAPLSLIGDDDGAIDAAQRQLSRVGIDRLEGASIASIRDLTGRDPTRSYPVVAFADLASMVDVSLIDVRLDDEWRSGHFAGAIHLPINELLARSDELPAGRLVVHCASGYRAAIAASMLDGLGRDVAVVNDDWVNAERSEREIVVGGLARH